MESAANTCYEASDLHAFIAALMQTHCVAAPARNGEKLEFTVLSDASQAVIDDTPTYKSAKEFLFPQSEKLISFTGGNAQLIEQTERTAVVGLRPCDLEAVRVLNAVFTGGKYRDPFFAARLEHTALIGLGCEKLKSGCFCNERGLDHRFCGYCDIFVTPSNGSYRLRAYSERGEELLADVCGRAGLEPAECAEHRGEPAQKPLLALPEAADDTVFDLKAWDTAAQTCIGCGTCTYICPTCHCFAFRDVQRGTEAARYRRWDSCMFPGFTLHASGHNPRGTKKERYRQRVMHKYLYVPRNFGLTACTGCGRCVRSCPAGISIRDVVSRAAKELGEAKA